MKLWEIAIVIIAIVGILFVAVSSYYVILDDQTIVDLNSSDSNSSNSSNDSIMSSVVNYTSNNSSNSSNGNTSSDSIINGTSGDYKLQIFSTTKWTLSYTVDGNNSQKTGNGNSTIDLGNIANYGNITLTQNGSGNSSIELYSGDGTFMQSVANDGNSVPLKFNLKIN